MNQCVKGLRESSEQIKCGTKRETGKGEEETSTKKKANGNINGQQTKLRNPNLKHNPTPPDFQQKGHPSEAEFPFLAL